MRILIGGDFAIGWETDWKKGYKKRAIFLRRRRGGVPPLPRAPSPPFKVKALLNSYRNCGLPRRRKRDIFI
ncbi:hypothetical protein OFP16_23890, partial [Escherichia coli]|nr:hypothetical protein [Escherichia coli]